MLNNYTKTDFDTMRRCAIRELNFRIKVYPKLINKGKMSEAEADFEIETMKKIKDYFDYLQIHAAPEQQKLF